MPKIDPKAADHITAYIHELPEPARLICLRLREIIRSASPALREDWKWGPNYNADGMVCGFGSFQKHTKLTFFRGGEMTDRHGLFNHCTDNIANRSIKYTDVAEVEAMAPELADYVREAVALNASGVPAVKKDTAPVTVPDALKKRLASNPVAFGHFKAMSPYKQKEFIEQVETAKRPETLEKRLEKIETLLTEGLGWNDKYRSKT